MEYKEFTSTQFADAIEIQRATMSHLLSERNKPSLDVIVKILSAFRDIDPNWLLLGEGEMKLSVASAAQQAASPAPEPGQLKQPEPQRHAGPVPVFSSTAKQVEQIVILYKDNSFVCYQPS
ncbi:transcriptional regulator [Pontibacter akesuensis]|nr:transcriptional regulator [Pontibacter akesuensis]